MKGKLALFRNDRKATEAQPDYTGGGQVDGHEVRCSAWINTARDSGKKYFSILVDDPRPRVDTLPATQQATSPPAAPETPRPTQRQAGPPPAGPDAGQDRGPEPAAPSDFDDIPF